MGLGQQLLNSSATKCLIAGRAGTPQPDLRVRAGGIIRARRDRLFPEIVRSRSNPGGPAVLTRIRLRTPSTQELSFQERPGECETSPTELMSELCRLTKELVNAADPIRHTESSTALWGYAFE